MDNSKEAWELRQPEILKKLNTERYEITFTRGEILYIPHKVDNERDKITGLNLEKSSLIADNEYDSGFKDGVNNIIRIFSGNK